MSLHSLLGTASAYPCLENPELSKVDNFQPGDGLNIAVLALPAARNSAASVQFMSTFVQLS